jgi:endonuclease/exonuclease/phosphatase (EEP) superfamily protein YafD
MSQWKERSHDSYLWFKVNKGATPNLIVCVAYVAPIGSKHESKSLFQNLATHTTKVQTLGDIVLLGGDFNAHTTVLPNTINNNNLCELL